MINRVTSNASEVASAFDPFHSHFSNNNDNNDNFNNIDEIDYSNQNGNNKDKTTLDMINDDDGEDINKSMTPNTNLEEKENDLSSQSIWTKIIKFLEVKQNHVSGTSDSRSEDIMESFLFNDDLKPVEEARRVWDWKNYVFFWISGSFNVNTWQISATGLQLGLSWGLSWVTIWVGYISVAIFVSLGSRIGNFYHISFPISSRISYGVYFSLWIVLNRVFMAVIWFATQVYIMGQTVEVMLLAIFGTDLPERIKNTIGDTQPITTFQFMCFMIAWGVTLPFMWIQVHNLKYLFMVKSVIVPFAGFGFLIWTLVKFDGKVAVGSLSNFHPTGSLLGWNFIRSVMSAMDNFSTLILNAPDFSRFGKTPRSSVYSQLFILPVMYAIIAIIGIITTASAYTVYKVNYWSPLDILTRFLDHQTKGNKGGVFVIALAFCIAQLGTNIASNSISAGTDMTALLPKFINIRRGSYICAVISLAICPWNLMTSSSRFTTVLAAYATFLSSIAGVVSSDYFLVRKGYVRLLHCYTNKPGSLYMYGKYGTNWRAVVAYILALGLNFPGFIAEVSTAEVKVNENGRKIFYLNYYVGYLASFLFYFVLCYFWPIEGTRPNTKITDFKAFREVWVEVENFDEKRRIFLETGEEGEYDEYNDEYVFDNESRQENYGDSSSSSDKVQMQTEIVADKKA
ncbi:hypothetical protein ACO0RG_001862 [Hanseniaspora osmophila]